MEKDRHNPVSETRDTPARCTEQPGDPQGDQGMSFRGICEKILRWGMHTSSPDESISGRNRAGPAQ